MRIAFLVNQFPTLSETFILNQIVGLLDYGHEVDIYADRPVALNRKHFDVEKYNLLGRTYYFPTMPRNWILRFLKALGLVFANAHKNPLLLVKSVNTLKYGKHALSLRLLYGVIPLLQQKPYDIIHCHFGTIGVKGQLLRDVGAIDGKLVTSFHGIDITMIVENFGKGFYQDLFNTGDLFLPISECWRNRLIELGCDPSKIFVHRMGIDCKKFAFTPRHLNSGESVKFITISRLVEKKGIEYGIRAIAKLIQVIPNIEYTVIGDGSLKQHLQKLIQELNLDEVVQLLGWRHQQEIIELIKNSHILLMPSITAINGDQEGIPVSGMEAMAMGTPVISTLHSGIPELVQDGISGFLVAERDIEALAERMSYLSQHSELWFEMGRSGRAFVEVNYNINQLNDKLMKTYQELLAKD